MDPVTPTSRPVERVHPAREARRELSRFAREAVDAAPAQQQEPLGDARPGDVIALPGGGAVVDVNRNGLVDGYDAVARPRIPGPALRIDLHA